MKEKYTYIYLSGQKRGVTELECIWPVILTGECPKIISSPENYNKGLNVTCLAVILLPLHPVSLRHKNPARRKIIYMVHVCIDGCTNTNMPQSIKCPICEI